MKEKHILDNLYCYLKNYHLGKENGIKRASLAKMLGVPPRTLRRMTKAINESMDYEMLVSTSSCCYVCETKEECIKSLTNTYRMAIALFKKAQKMERKVKLNGQFKIPLSAEDTQAVYSTFTFSKDEHEKI